jgi:AcrR family transcriptional regulator
MPRSPLAAVELSTAAQLARRERILDAVVELADAGGYDAVQMREVADRAEVALGTLYRYFPSKVHLLVSAMARTLAELADSQAAGNDSDSTPQERIYRVVARVTDYLVSHRRLSGSMIRALVTAGVDAGREVDAVAELMVGLIATATHEPGVAPCERDAALANIIGKVWLADALTLLAHRMTVEELLADLDATISLVMTRRG